MSRRRFVVAGTGRSGTLYLARLLTACGLRTSHELAHMPPLPLGPARAREVWKRRVRPHLATAGGGMGPRLEALVPFVGDCSWMCVPALPELTCTRVLVVRHPAATIDSMRRKRFLGAPYAPHTAAWLRRNFELWDDGRNDEARFWVEWNDRALDHVELVLRLEDLGPAAVAGIADRAGLAIDTDRVATAFASVSPATNTVTSARPSAGSTARLDEVAPGLDDGVRAGVERMAERLGYRL